MEKEFGFYRFFWERGERSSRTWVFSPPTNVYEDDENFIILIEIAGVKKENVKVEILGNSVIISGVREDPILSGVVTFHNLEINFGRFEKIIHINEAIDADGAKVSYFNGFLKIEIPKKRKRIFEIKIEGEE